MLPVNKLNDKLERHSLEFKRPPMQCSYPLSI